MSRWCLFWPNDFFGSGVHSIPIGSNQTQPLSEPSKSHTVSVRTCQSRTVLTRLYKSILYRNGYAFPSPIRDNWEVNSARCGCRCAAHHSTRGHVSGVSGAQRLSRKRLFVTVRRLWHATLLPLTLRKITVNQRFQGLCRSSRPSALAIEARATLSYSFHIHIQIGKRRTFVA